MVIDRRRGIAVVVSVLAVLVVGLLVINPMYLGVGVVPDCGLCYISGVQDPNSNATYSVVFHGVNFTYLYSTYPFQVTDMPHVVYFQITFADYAVENLTLSVGGYVAIHSSAPLRTNMTQHSHPKAGLGTADTNHLWGKWVLIVTA
ncbi:MAG: hypothetical protein ACE5H4_13995 [Candidatus Thorarchaeota archaeon]